MLLLQKNHTVSDCFLCQKTAHGSGDSMLQNSLPYGTAPVLRLLYLKPVSGFHINNCDHNRSYTRLPDPVSRHSMYRLPSAAEYLFSVPVHGGYFRPLLPMHSIFHLQDYIPTFPDAIRLQKSHYTHCDPSSLSDSNVLNTHLHTICD